MEDTKRLTIIARTLAAVVAALGAYFVYIIVAAIFKHFLPPSDTFDIFFLFVFPLPFSAFGIYCIYSGYRFWFKISPENTRRIAFVTAIIILFLLLPAFSSVFQSGKPDDFLTPLLLIVAGIFFLLFNRLLINLLNLPTATDWVQREKSAKRYFSWFAFFLWSSSFNLLHTYLPPEKFASDDIKSLLVPLLAIGTTIPAYAVYKLGVAIALRNKPKKSEIPPYPPANSPLLSPEH
jgi:hypothetical protein